MEKHKLKQVSTFSSMEFLMVTAQCCGAGLFFVDAAVAAPPKKVAQLKKYITKTKLQKSFFSFSIIDEFRPNKINSSKSLI